MRFKRIVVKIVFFVLGRCLMSASRHDRDIQQEIGPWPEGFVVAMDVWPSGPRMELKKRGHMMVPVKKSGSSADLVITFKNMDSAFMVMTPQMGAPVAFAQRRIMVSGSLTDAMIFTRCLNAILVYLYPAFISRRLVKRVPRFGPVKRLIQAKVLILGVFGI